MEAQFRVVFTGRIQDGLDPARVKQEAATRLKASPTQLDQLFSLPRVILKKSVDAGYGHAYVQALQEIGMLVDLEPLSPEAPGPTAENISQTMKAPPSQSMPEAQSAPDVPPPEVRKELPPEENVIIPDIPALVTASAAMPDPVADDLARSLAPLEAAYPGTGAPNSSIISSYERMQANLARAEALLNASHKPAASPHISTEPALSPDPVQPHTGPLLAVGDQAASTGTGTRSPEHPAPQHEAPASQIAQAPLLFRTTIECTACGTPHIIEGRLLVSILPSGEVVARMAPG